MLSTQFRSTTPASDWEQALISGNGSLGALVFGDPAHEILTLSHEGLFMPLCRPLPAVGTAPSLSELRALLLDGQYHVAAERVITIAQQEGYQGLHWVDPLVPGFDLKLTTPISGIPTNYTRSVDFRTGVVEVRWSDERGDWTRRLFVSRADSAAVLSIQPPAGQTIDCTLTLAITGLTSDGEKQFFEEGVQSVTINVEGNLLSYRSRFRRSFPGSLRGYDGIARLHAPQGTLIPGHHSITVQGATEILVLLDLVLIEQDEDEAVFAALRQRLEALPTDFAHLLDRHVPLHGALFNRVTLDLGGAQEREQASEELLASARQQSGGLPPVLFELLFQAGRYAIISSCGKQPPTLQGIWTGTWTPAWSSAFTHNGNLPIALCSLLSTSTPELMHAYFDYLESLLDDFRENAQRLYHCRGIYLPTHTSTHGKQNHFHQLACHTFWTAGAAWAAHYYYDYWQYTGDRAFLAHRALPFLEEAVAFFEDFLIPGPDGHLLFLPSLSPENSPANTGSQASISATMDLALVKELVRHVISASQLVGVNSEKIPQWEALLQRLPAYRLNDQGELAEWIWPTLQDNHAHRHPSHLYPLFYEIDPDLEHDPRLLQAAHAALEARLLWWRGEEIEQHDMAFGLVMLGLAAAHLHLPETVQEIAGWLATRYWRSSLVSTHNNGSIFNVDIAGGVPGLIGEMLVQSHQGRIKILPLLPASWSRGSLKGITCRGAITIDELTWQPQHIRLRLHANQAQQITLMFPAPLVALQPSAEQICQWSGTQAVLALLPQQPIMLEIQVL